MILVRVTLAFALALALALVAPTALAAATYPDPGKVPVYYDSECYAKYSKRFVHDYIGTISSLHGNAIEAAACDVYANTSAHFVVVTVQDTGGESIENYALHLFRAWGIGDASRNDGALLLFVKNYTMSGKSSAARLEVGYGLEGVLNGHLSAETIRAMQNEKADALDAGYSVDEANSFAIGAGAYYALSSLDASYTDGHFPAANPSSSGPPLWFWGLVVVIFILLVAFNATRRRSWGYYPGSPSWSSGVGRSWSSGGFGGGGSGGWGGGGGGGFGGGRSGGGGGSGGL